ncbi:hypothetical protein GCM10009780_56350 [Actinomadura alba]
MNISALKTRCVAAAAVTAMVLAAAACGDDGATKGAASSPSKATPTAPAGNGVAEKSADEIVAAAKNAFGAATSVHVKGNFEDAGHKIAIDLSLGRDGTKGTITAPVEGKTYPVSLISVNEKFYMKSPKLWRAVGGAAAANLIGNRWVLIPKDDSKDFEDFEQLADLEKFSDEMLSFDDEVFTKGSPTVVDGKPVITLKGSDSIVYVATTGTPYIIRLEPSAAAERKKGQAIQFLDYNAPVNVVPPTDVLDLAELQS